MNGFDFNVVNTNQLDRVELPSNRLLRSFGLARDVQWFYVDKAMAAPLAEAFELVKSSFPQGFSTIRTFVTSNQQQELFADYRTGKTKMVAASAQYSAREIGRSIDIDMGSKLCTDFDDDEDMIVLSVRILQRIMEPLGFICVDDGHAEVFKTWRAVEDVLHLEFWADVDGFSQSLRDSIVKERLIDLYRVDPEAAIL